MVIDVAGAEEAPPDAALLGTTPGYYVSAKNLRKLGKRWPGEDEARMVREYDPERSDRSLTSGQIYGIMALRWSDLRYTIYQQGAKGKWVTKFG